ncbi:hypothetical protein KC726_02620 [Candidatus Woesebacteria bacterium]|nr:hypothetical protein [Candidatus Woesebacteria bacterium]
MKKFFLFLVLFIFATNRVWAQETTLLLFDSSTIKTSVGNEFSLTIQMYSFNNKLPIRSADIWIAYDPSIVQPVVENGVVSVGSGDLFNEIGGKIINNKLYLFGLNAASPKSETIGAFGTIRFKALQQGKTSLRFVCEPGIQQTTQIIGQNDGLKNIINCAGTKSHTADIVISGTDVLGATDSLHNSMSTILMSSLLLFVGTATVVLVKRFDLFNRDNASQDIT